MARLVTKRIHRNRRIADSQMQDTEMKHTQEVTNQYSALVDNFHAAREAARHEFYKVGYDHNRVADSFGKRERETFGAIQAFEKVHGIHRCEATLEDGHQCPCLETTMFYGARSTATWLCSEHTGIAAAERVEEECRMRNVGRTIMQVSRDERQMLR